MNQKTREEISTKMRKAAHALLQMLWFSWSREGGVMAKNLPIVNNSFKSLNVMLVL